jgi:flagellar motor protein MotB
MLGLFMIALILGITTKVVELLPGPGDTIVVKKADYVGYKKDSDRLEAIEAELNNERDARKKAESLLAVMTQERDHLLNENMKLLARITELERQIKELESENETLRGDNDKPPILVVDATQVSFEKGKAELLKIHERKLRKDVFSELLTIVKKYKSVNTIEIIGHTDRSPVGGKSNLDYDLLKALKGEKINILTAGSNADLGLMRAIAVKQAWNQWLKGDEIELPRPIMIRCYSAAQGIAPAAIDGKFLADQARRIEIRFTQLKALEEGEDIEWPMDWDSTDEEKMLEDLME